MSKQIYIVLLTITLLIVAGCECVLTIDPDKQFIPTEFAYALIVHAMQGTSVIEVESDGLRAVSGIEYNNTDYVYTKVGAGTTNLRLIAQSDRSTIFNSMFEFKLNGYYSIIFYGPENRIRALVINDSLALKDLSKSYIRFINVAMASPNIIFKLKSPQLQTPPTSYRNYSQLYQVEPGRYTLEAVNEKDSLLYKIDNFELKPGFVANTLLQGDFSEHAEFSPSLVVAGAELNITKNN